MNEVSNTEYRYQVGGSLEPNAPSYVERQADRDFYNALKAGEFCYVLHSRQMGKSSLRVQVMKHLQADGVACGVVDITSIGSYEITQAEWYLGVVRRLARSFRSKIKPVQWWDEQEGLSPLQRLSAFIEEVLLSEITHSIVIFIDEIDSILKLNFKDDFFALIRSCYNHRAENSEYKRLTFALLGVATPSDLIQDKKRTPFNVGKAIDIKGFQFHEAQCLIKGLEDSTECPQEVLRTILYWTGGQPFLTQKLCQLICENLFSIPKGDESKVIERLIEQHIVDRWETQDRPEHLTTIRDRLLSDESKAGRLLGIYQQILELEEIDTRDTPEKIELQLSGLVAEDQQKLRVQNPIYKLVFNVLWINQAFDNLRPYAPAIKAWLDSDRQDKSQLLRGQTLKKAQDWTEDKSLSEKDYQFLAASQELEKIDAQIALEVEKQAKSKAEQILEEAQVKAKQRILASSAISIFTIAIAGTSVLLAQQRIHEVSNERTAIANSLKLVENNLNVAEQDVEQAKTELKSAQAEAKDANQELLLANRSVDKVNRELFQAKTELEKLDQESTTKSADLQSAIQKVNSLEEKARNAEQRQKNAETRTLMAEVNLQQAESSLKSALVQLGSNYLSLGNYENAGQTYEQLLEISQDDKNSVIEGRARQGLGNTFTAQGNYNAAIRNLERSIAIAREAEDLLLEGNTLNDLGLTFYQLGDYVQANEYFQQSLIIASEINDSLGQGRVLRNIGLVHIAQGEYNEAIKKLEQSLEIIEEFQENFGEDKSLVDRFEEARSLAALGSAYSFADEKEQANNHLQQSWDLMQTLGDRSGIGEVLRSLGALNANSEDYQQAFDFYSQSLSIWQELGDRANESTTLRFLGELLSKQEQPELAITFYKQSFNIIGDIQKQMPTDLRQLFEKTFSDDLRALAALLLEQKRLDEARQILISLEVQELTYLPDSYIRTETATTQQGIGVLQPPEETILSQYATLIAQANELSQLQQTPYEQLTPKQKNRLAELMSIESEIRSSFIDFADHPEIQAQIRQLRVNNSGQNIELEQLLYLQDDLSKFPQKNAVLLYPLILDDRLELIILTAKAPPLRRPVAINRTELNRAVIEYRRVLQDPNSNPRIIAQQFYEWIIQPLESDLAAVNAETIIYVPDGILRYIPLSALYDGNSWLVENYTTNYITAASLTDFDDVGQPERLSVVAAARKHHTS
ncbi:MAG: tetratricopeptide repeat protein [Leptolyngbya sp. SIO3F4]|nr:tetratricopeptide repeat protein [Leptolyngbya sp. SIO3F4]